MIRNSAWVRSIVPFISSFLVVPPPLFAQAEIPPAPPQPDGSLRGGASVAAHPDQPLLTSSSALLPLRPSWPACPASGGGGAEPGDTGGPLQGPGPLPAHPGLLSSVLQQHADPLAQQASAGIERLSIEQSFARFFVLEGITGKLKQFGYDFFETPFSGVSPVMDVPVGPDYVLGPDDTLSIQIWNVPDASMNRSYVAPVERDGTIFIPQVGTVPVGGATFSEAKKLVEARLRALIKRFELHVSMARLRTIKVYVVGEINRPGSYDVSSLATASHALYAGCGPSRSGSLRRIRVVREGSTAAELDFYDFLLQGDRTQDIRLRSGDTIVVPPIGPVAGISGPVRRPAIYEIEDHTRLGALTALAGGLTPAADRRRCQIFRIDPKEGRIILEVGSRSLGADHAASARGPEGDDPALRDGDFVRLGAVSTHLDHAVTLGGAVRNPGPYAFRPGMRIGDLLTPEELQFDAYLDQAELIRTDPVTFETSLILFSPRKLFEGKGDNVELRRLDKIVVATQTRPPRVVTLSGEVVRPGKYLLTQDERLSSVLQRAGGFTPSAFPEGLELLRETVRASHQKEVEKFVAIQRQRLIGDAAALAAGDVQPGGGGRAGEQTVLQIQLQSLGELAARTTGGRIVIRARSIEALERSKEDLILENGDKITIPEKPYTVTVIGSVRNPTTIAHDQDWDVDDYIARAGGFAVHADEDGVYVVRADGSTIADVGGSHALRPGDTLVVPEALEPKTRTIPLLQAITGILASLATTALVIVVVAQR